MVTSLGDISNGKENLPADSANTPHGNKPLKAPQTKSKHDKSKSAKVPEGAITEPQGMNQAFDRMLVSHRPSVCHTWTFSDE